MFRALRWGLVLVRRDLRALSVERVEVGKIEARMSGRMRRMRSLMSEVEVEVEVVDVVVIVGVVVVDLPEGDIDVGLDESRMKRLIWLVYQGFR